MRSPGLSSKLPDSRCMEHGALCSGRLRPIPYADWRNTTKVHMKDGRPQTRTPNQSPFHSEPSRSTQCPYKMPPKADDNPAPGISDDQLSLLFKVCERAQSMLTSKDWKEISETEGGTAEAT